MCLEVCAFRVSAPLQFQLQSLAMIQSVMSSPASIKTTCQALEASRQDCLIHLAWTCDDPFPGLSDPQPKPRTRQAPEGQGEVEVTVEDTHAMNPQEFERGLLCQ